MSLPYSRCVVYFFILASPFCISERRSGVWFRATLLPEESFGAVRGTSYHVLRLSESAAPNGMVNFLLCACGARKRNAWTASLDPLQDAGSSHSSSPSAPCSGSCTSSEDGDNVSEATCSVCLAAYEEEEVVRIYLDRVLNSHHDSSSGGMINSQWFHCRGLLRMSEGSLSGQPLSVVSVTVHKDSPFSPSFLSFLRSRFFLAATNSILVVLIHG